MRALSVSMNGSENITPNASPVSSIEKIHNRILPKRRDNGIHIGTENVDGIMYARMIAGARSRRPTTYCATYNVSAPIAAEPTFSMNVTMINSRACGLRQTSEKAWYGMPDLAILKLGALAQLDDRKQHHAQHQSRREPRNPRGRITRRLRPFCFGVDEDLHADEREDRTERKRRVTQSEQPAAFVVVRRHLGAERHVRHREQRDRGIEADDADRHPDRQTRTCRATPAAKTASRTSRTSE